MAHATNAQITNHLNPLGAILGFFRAIGNALINIAEANPRLNRARDLMDMTDEQLAARGLKREEIVKHVFSDTMYI